MMHEHFVLQQGAGPYLEPHSEAIGHWHSEYSALMYAFVQGVFQPHVVLNSRPGTLAIVAMISGAQQVAARVHVCADTGCTYS